MDFELVLRNWLWPAAGAAAGAVIDAAYQMYSGCGLAVECFDQVELVRVGGAALFGFVATKFNGIGGKDQKWFSHDKGDSDPHHT